MTATWLRQWPVTVAFVAATIAGCSDSNQPSSSAPVPASELLAYLSETELVGVADLGALRATLVDTGLGDGDVENRVQRSIALVAFPLVSPLARFDVLDPSSIRAIASNWPRLGRPSDGWSGFLIAVQTDQPFSEIESSLLGLEFERTGELLTNPERGGLSAAPGIVGYDPDAKVVVMGNELATVLLALDKPGSINGSATLDALALLPGPVRIALRQDLVDNRSGEAGCLDVAGAGVDIRARRATIVWFVGDGADNDRIIVQPGTTLPLRPSVVVTDDPPPTLSNSFLSYDVDTGDDADGSIDRWALAVEQVYGYVNNSEKNPPDDYRCP